MHVECWMRRRCVRRTAAQLLALLLLLCLQVSSHRSCCWAQAAATTRASPQGASSSNHLQQLFDSLDSDQDGQLRKQELRLLVSRLSPEYTASSSTLDAAVEGVIGRLDSPDVGLGVSQLELEQHLHTLLQDVQVADWVSHGLGLAQYADAFRANAITTLDLPMLINDGGKLLQTELKVESPLHRQKLLRAMQRQILGLGSPPGPLTALHCAATSTHSSTTPPAPSSAAPGVDAGAAAASSAAAAGGGGGSGGVVCSWQPPLDPGQPAMHKYVLQRVEHSSASMSASWRTVADLQDSLSVRFLDVPPRAGVYQYRLAAWNLYGRSPYVLSEDVTVTLTNHQQPHQPQQQGVVGGGGAVAPAVAGALHAVSIPAAHGSQQCYQRPGDNSCSPQHLQQHLQQQPVDGLVVQQQQQQDQVQDALAWGQGSPSSSSSHHTGACANNPLRQQQQQLYRQFSHPSAANGAGAAGNSVVWVVGLDSQHPQHHQQQQPWHHQQGGSSNNNNNLPATAAGRAAQHELLAASLRATTAAAGGAGGGGGLDSSRDRVTGGSAAAAAASGRAAASSGSSSSSSQKPPTTAGLVALLGSAWHSSFSSWAKAVINSLTAFALLVLPICVRLLPVHVLTQAAHVLAWLLHLLPRQVWRRLLLQQPAADDNPNRNQQLQEQASPAKQAGFVGGDDTNAALPAAGVAAATAAGGGGGTAPPQDASTAAAPAATAVVRQRQLRPFPRSVSEFDLVRAQGVSSSLLSSHNAVSTGASNARSTASTTAAAAAASKSMHSLGVPYRHSSPVRIPQQAAAAAAAAGGRLDHLLPGGGSSPVAGGSLAASSAVSASGSPQLSGLLAGAGMRFASTGGYASSPSRAALAGAGGSGLAGGVGALLHLPSSSSSGHRPGSAGAGELSTAPGHALTADQQLLWSPASTAGSALQQPMSLVGVPTTSITPGEAVECELQSALYGGAAAAACAPAVSGLPDNKRCSFPGCQQQFGLRQWKATLQRHYCGRCQQAFCLQHTAYSPHGTNGTCGVQSRCLCIDCFYEYTPEYQAFLASRNTLIGSKRSKSGPPAAAAAAAAAMGVGVEDGSAGRSGGSGLGGSGNGSSSSSSSKAGRVLSRLLPATLVGSSSGGGGGSSSSNSKPEPEKQEQQEESCVQQQQDSQLLFAAQQPTGTPAATDASPAQGMTLYHADTTQNDPEGAAAAADLLQSHQQPQTQLAKQRSLRPDAVAPSAHACSKGMHSRMLWGRALTKTLGVVRFKHAGDVHAAAGALHAGVGGGAGRGSAGVVAGVADTVAVRQGKDSAAV